MPRSRRKEWETVLYARTRDLESDGGPCLRVSVSPHPSGAMVTLERLDETHRPSILLSLFGAEILNGFIMSARLSMPHAMPSESTAGPFPARFHLDRIPAPRVLVEQDERFPVAIDACMWDRLYAELCLVIAHGRELAHQANALLH